jgi:hypothetical protein
MVKYQMVQKLKTNFHLHIVHQHQIRRILTLTNLTINPIIFSNSTKFVSNVTLTQV